MYVSATDPEPSHASNDQQHKSPHSVTVASNQKQFTTQYIYVSLLARDGVICTVNPVFSQFAESKSNQHSRSLTERGPASNLMAEDPFADYHKRLQQRSKKPNFILANKLLHSARRVTNFEQRKELASESRRKQQDYKVTKHIVKSIKWDIIRQKKQELLEEQQQVIKKQQRAKKFVLLCAFYSTIKLAVAKIKKLLI